MNGELILLVDDEPNIIELAQLYLEREGFQVISASDGRDALEAVEKHHPALMVLDLMMPEMDGFTALKLFKETRSDLPIILLTANVPEEKCIEAIKLGAMDVIEKPADLNLLTQKIEEAKALKVNVPHAEHEASGIPPEKGGG